MNFDHQMSLSMSKCWYSNNCLHFLKCAVPLMSYFFSFYTFTIVFKYYFFYLLSLAEFDGFFMVTNLGYTWMLFSIILLTESYQYYSHKVLRKTVNILLRLNEVYTIKKVSQFETNWTYNWKYSKNPKPKTESSKCFWILSILKTKKN